MNQKRVEGGGGGGNDQGDVTGVGTAGWSQSWLSLVRPGFFAEGGAFGFRLRFVEVLALSCPEGVPEGAVDDAPFKRFF